MYVRLLVFLRIAFWTVGMSGAVGGLIIRCIVHDVSCAWFAWTGMEHQYCMRLQHTLSCFRPLSGSLDRRS